MEANLNKKEKINIEEPNLNKIFLKIQNQLK